MEQSVTSTRVSIEHRCLIALSTLKEGRQEMNGADFGAILIELCHEMNLQIKVQPDSFEKSKRGADLISQEIDGETSFNIGPKGKITPRVDRRRLSIKDIDSK
jgi:hypothetical protein